MAEIVLLAHRQKPLQMETEPCHKCDKQELCRNTCERARIWWDIFAKQHKGENHD